MHPKRVRGMFRGSPPRLPMQLLFCIRPQWSIMGFAPGRDAGALEDLSCTQSYAVGASSIAWRRAMF